jgi:hypothetical protein
MEEIMRASSDSISELAAAMAKAQSELVNPPKSLTAVLERGRNGMGPISYRYAPLSAGLDILRKTLGKYELATIQTTRIDADRGLVLLTTTIAHSSGEWMSGTWPVCHITDMGHPKLMGASLTYARRYCLFTMVGLAGEDDIDAPPLETKDKLQSGSQTADRVVEVAAVNSLPDESAAETAQHEHEGATSEPAYLLDTGASPVEEVRREEPPPARRRSPRRSLAKLISAQASDPFSDLALIHDADALLRWAALKMPIRNGLDTAARDAFDAAFLAKADAVGVDPELLIPFEWQRDATQPPNSPAPPD